MKRRVLLLLLAVILLISITPIQAQEGGELIVFAAASLTDAFEAIADSFEQEYPNAEILFNFGSSSTLSAQLVQGAPADIFASANNAQMQVAVDGGRIADEPRTFARNRLVLIVPADNPANIQSLRDLANPGINLILAAPEVPIRVYTDTMLELMANDPAYGEAFREAVIANIVSEEPNVRQVAAKIALGEADAGIVYLSDVTPDIADDIIALLIPDAFNTIATYPIAITDDTDQPELAGRFLEFILSDTGQDILVEWGFISVRIPPVVISGQVQTPLTLTIDNLRDDYEAQILVINIAQDGMTGTNTFTGVSLWDILNSTLPVMDADAQAGMVIVVTGTDGYESVITWEEIDPVFGNQPILIAYEENGIPIEETIGGLRLVVPSDSSGARYVTHVVSIILGEATD